MALIRQFDLVVPLVTGTAADDVTWAKFITTRGVTSTAGEHTAKVREAPSS